MNIELGSSESTPLSDYRNENGETSRLGNMLPRLIPKLMEVFEDPSVIEEITQHKIKSRQNDPNINSNQIWKEQNSQYSITNSTHDNVNLEEGRLLDDPTIETDDTDDYKSCSSSTISRRKINKEVQEKSSKYLKNKRIAYACIIAAVFLLAIVLAGSLTIFVLWLAVNSGSILILDQLYNTCNGLLEVSVKSLDEYNTAFETAGKQKLSINIELDRPNDWPTGIQLHSSNNINDIRIAGPFHAKKFTGLLRTISKLEKLHLDNKGNLMCTESLPPIKTFDAGKTVNITVKELILEGFVPLCSKVLGIVHESIEFHKLETFRFISGVINSENVDIFEKLLERYKNTLKRLEITDTALRTSIFSDQYSLMFKNVHELVLETSQDDVNAFITPLYNICTIFPNLQRLSFGTGLTRWNDIKNVYNCKELKSLQIKIWVQPPNHNFSLGFLSDQFPNLEGAEVTLLFENTFPSSNTICEDKIRNVEGRKYLSKLLLANLRITSNCKLKFMR